MKLLGQDIYYYDTVDSFETEKFAGRFLKMLFEEMKKQQKNKILFLCIGTDRSTGDSLGPLIGHKLVERGIKNAIVLGTLDRPIHAMNLDYCLSDIREKFSDCIVVAIDASIGETENIGCVTLGRGPLKPGLGVRKELGAVGDLFITGIVGSSKASDPLILQSVRLSVVMRLADCISKSVFLGMDTMGNYVEKFCAKSSLF